VITYNDPFAVEKLKPTRLRLFRRSSEASPSNKTLRHSEAVLRGQNYTLFSDLG